MLSAIEPCETLERADEADRVEVAPQLLVGDAGVTVHDHSQLELCSELGVVADADELTGPPFVLKLASPSGFELAGAIQGEVVKTPAQKKGAQQSGRAGLHMQNIFEAIEFGILAAGIRHTGR